MKRPNPLPASVDASSREKGSKRCVRRSSGIPVPEVLNSDLKTVHVLDTQHHAARITRIHQRVIDQVVQNAQRSVLVTLSDSRPDPTRIDDDTAMEQAGPRLRSFGCRPSDLSEIDVVVAPSTAPVLSIRRSARMSSTRNSSLLQLQAEHLEWRAPRIRCRPEAPVRQHREISTRDTKWGAQIVDDLDDLVGQRSDRVSNHGNRSTDLQLPRGSPAAQSHTSKLYIGTIHKLYAQWTEIGKCMPHFRSIGTVPYPCTAFPNNAHTRTNFVPGTLAQCPDRTVSRARGWPAGSTVGLHVA